MNTDASRHARQLAKKLRRAAFIVDDVALLREMDRVSDDYTREQITVALNIIKGEA